MKRPAVFLDRDGVLNRTIVRDGIPRPPNSLEEVEILPGVHQALLELADLQVPLIVVSNQPDVARGTQTRQNVEAINRYLSERLPLTQFYTCFHDTADDCSCRKPKPGLLLQAAEAHGIDLSRSFMVGDRWSDVIAGQAAGCRAILIEREYSQAERCRPDYRVSLLSESVKIMMDSLRGRIESRGGCDQRPASGAAKR